MRFSCSISRFLFMNINDEAVLLAEQNVHELHELLWISFFSKGQQSWLFIYFEDYPEISTCNFLNCIPQKLIRISGHSHNISVLSAAVGLNTIGDFLNLFSTSSVKIICGTAA